MAHQIRIILKIILTIRKTMGENGHIPVLARTVKAIGPPQINTHRIFMVAIDLTIIALVVAKQHLLASI